MTAAQDAARYVLRTDLDADARACARFVLAVCEPDKALVETVARAAREAIDGYGSEPGSSIHSWRCEYPERYGPCTCVADMAVDVARAALAAVAQSAGGEHG